MADVLAFHALLLGQALSHATVVNIPCNWPLCNSPKAFACYMADMVVVKPNSLQKQSYSSADLVFLHKQHQLLFWYRQLCASTSLLNRSKTWSQITIASDSLSQQMQNSFFVHRMMLKRLSQHLQPAQFQTMIKCYSYARRLLSAAATAQLCSE